jgi:hypothetical protein
MRNKENLKKKIGEMSPRPKRCFPRKINKTLKKVVKVNLLNILNENIARPIRKLVKIKESIELRKSKIQADFHYSPTPKAVSKRIGKENLKKSNIKDFEFSSTEKLGSTEKSLRQQLKEFCKKSHAVI